MPIDQIGDFHVDLSGQHHLHDFHRGFIGHSNAMAEFRFDAEPIEHLVDLRSAAMDDDRIDSDIFQQHDILRKPFLERRVRHRMAAVFDDHGLARETCECTAAPRSARWLS